MAAEEILATFRGVAQGFYRYAAEEKGAQGRPAIGCLPMYPPEEMVHAAGMRPIILLAKGEPVTLGRAYVQAYMCSYVNSLVDMALKGRLDFLDGILLPDTCYAIRGIAGTLQRHLPSMYHYAFPLPAVQRREVAKEWLLEVLRRFRKDLEEHFLVSITPEGLAHSLKVYNGHRALMRRLYRLRRRNPALMRLSDMVAVVIASMVMPKEEHAALLVPLLEEWEAKPPQGDRRTKLVLSGHFCDDPDGQLLRLLEELPIAVVDDDLYTGGRYFATDAPLTGDPLEGLAERYLDLIPCPTRLDLSKDYGDYLVALAQGSGAQGVVMIMVKFCDPHLMDYPYLRSKLEQAGIPCLAFETELEQIPYGTTKNRLQAFLEMLA